MLVRTSKDVLARDEPAPVGSIYCEQCDAYHHPSVHNDAWRKRHVRAGVMATMAIFARPPKP